MYGKVAVESAKMCNSANGSLNPEDAWEQVIPKYTNSLSSQKKSCPKNTYLGFYASGQIIGCPSVKFIIHKSKKHEQGRKILKALQNPGNQNKSDLEIWRSLPSIGTKAYNGEVKVVRALRDANLLS